MNFNKIISGRADYAEREEVRDSEGRFAADVREIVDSAIEEGVHFELGADKAALEKLLSVLGIDQDIEKSTEGGYMNYIQALYGSGGSSGGRSPEVVVPIIKKYGIVKTLELLQAESWHVEKKQVIGERLIAAGGVVTSQLMLLHSEEDEKGVPRTELESIGVVIGMYTRMEVDLVTEHGYMSEDGIERVFDDIKRGTDHPSELPASLGNYLDSMDESLLFPAHGFYVRIGKCQSGGMFSGITDVRVFSNYYDLVGGRFVRDAKRSGDIEDDVDNDYMVPQAMQKYEDDDDSDWRDDFHDLDDDYSDEDAR